MPSHRQRGLRFKPGQNQSSLIHGASSGNPIGNPTLALPRAPIRRSEAGSARRQRVQSTKDRDQLNEGSASPLCGHDP